MLGGKKIFLYLTYFGDRPLSPYYFSYLTFLFKFGVFGAVFQHKHTITSVPLKKAAFCFFKQSNKQVTRKNVAWLAFPKVNTETLLLRDSTAAASIRACGMDSDKLPVASAGDERLGSQTESSEQQHRGKKVEVQSCSSPYEETAWLCVTLIYCHFFHFFKL